MHLRHWQELYARAERAARLFFAEHFSDLCGHCFTASLRRADPGLTCCRRVNLLPDIISDPLLGDLAERSLGRSLLPLAAPHNEPGCAALGSEGCRIPLGRPDICNTYVCRPMYQSAAKALPAGASYQLQEALDVFTRIANAERHRNDEYQACVADVDALEALLDHVSFCLRREAAVFADGKAESIFDLYPPERGDG